MADDDGLRHAREETCLGHLRAENAHEFDRAIGFFARPRYDLVATGEVDDGAGPLGGLMQENLTTCPDVHSDITQLDRADEAFIVESPAPPASLMRSA